jgi:hypothetical protein
MLPPSRSAEHTPELAGTTPADSIADLAFGCNVMAILKFLGVALIVVGLVLWLAVKITFGAVHLLLLIGLAMLVAGFIKRAT